MAWLERRRQHFRIVFRFRGQRYNVNLKATAQKEANACLARLEATCRKLAKARREGQAAPGPGPMAKAIADLTSAGELVNPRDKRGYRLPDWPRRNNTPSLFDELPPAEWRSAGAASDHRLKRTTT